MAPAVRWVTPALIAATFAALAWWTWGAWPDAAVDFGQQAYLPWRVAEGEVLYRDLAFFNGPLSVQINALLFNVFGPHLRTLFLANLAVLAAVTWLAHGLLLAVADRTTALVGSLFLLVVSGFGHLVTIGNYTFVAPYAHELTHGMLLVLAALACMRQFRSGGQVRWLVAAGLLAGATVLTKAELSAAAVPALLLDVGLTLAARNDRRRWSVLLAALVAPVAVAFLLQLRVMPAEEALWAVLGGWRVALRGDVADLPFFRRGLGVDDVGRSLGLLAGWTARWLALAALAVATGLMLQRFRPRSPRVETGVAVLAGLATMLWVWQSGLAWKHVARPLPLLAAGLLVTGLVLWRRTRDPVWIPRVSLALLALGLVGKMALNTRLHHYGFVLALPAALLAVALLVHGLPLRTARWGGQALVPRGVAVGAVLGLCAALLQVTAGHVAAKRVPVGQGPDAFRGDAAAVYVNAAAGWLLEPQGGAPGPARTLAVLPEGAMVNLLTRRVNPTGYTTLMPTELRVFGEAAVLAAFQARPPDDIVVLHKDTSEFGARFFGKDYAPRLGAWLRANYRQVRQAGAEPLTGDGYGVALWQRLR